MRTYFMLSQKTNSNWLPNNQRALVKAYIEFRGAKIDNDPRVVQMEGTPHHHIAQQPIRQLFPHLTFTFKG